MKTKMNANNSYREVPDAALRREIEDRAYYIWLASGRGMVITSVIGSRQKRN